MNSGLLVPALEIECTFCRVTSLFAASQLSDEVRCEFCGETFKLSFALSLSKGGKWKYRLAGHLPAERVEAMIPVLATIGVIGSFSHVSQRADCEMLGLEVVGPGGRRVEADIAAFLEGPVSVTIIGEVKSSNRIDANDVDNLEYLGSLLTEQKRRYVTLFATAKEQFSATEVSLLRTHAESAMRSYALWRRSIIVFPLIFTKADMSRPWDHAEHPWRWGQPGQGIFGISIESCRRNLGLTGPAVVPAPLEWSDADIDFAAD